MEDVELVHLRDSPTRSEHPASTPSETGCAGKSINQVGGEVLLSIP
jgi:hypothetical protein